MAGVAGEFVLNMSDKKYSITDHWLAGSAAPLKVESCNCDDRPDQEDISLIVIHCISLPPGEFGGPYISDLFTNRLSSLAHPYFREVASLQVSSHLLIRRDGEVIQYVPFHKRAWHAGESSFRERSNCNDFSVGIELEGTDDGPYEEVQYEVLAEVIQSLCEEYPKLSYNGIVGHSDIAPGRKSDPGPGFNRDYLQEKLSRLG